MQWSLQNEEKFVVIIGARRNRILLIRLIRTALKFQGLSRTYLKFRLLVFSS